MHPNTAHLEGQRFGRLTVQSLLPHKKGQSGQRWICKCDCGGETVLPTGELRNKRYGSDRGCRQCLSFHSGPKSKNWVGHGGLSGSEICLIRTGAKKRGFEFSVDIKQLWELFQSQVGKCALSGIPIVLSTNRKTRTASLDRKDSKLGYILENVQWVHKDVNFMKRTMTDMQFIDWVFRIAKFQQQAYE